MTQPYVNRNMRSHPLPMQNGFVPQKGREKWKVEENQSPSVYDPVFENLRDANPGRVEIKVSSQKAAAILTDAKGRLTISQEAIADHLEERISAFLMQLIDTYDTPWHFTVGVTESQTESTPTLKLKIDTPSIRNPPLSLQFNSAHHGTIPCLYAYPRHDWEAWRRKANAAAPGKPQGIVYLKYSDTYLANNACTGLEKEVNLADISIDGNATEKSIEFGPQKSLEQKKLREYSIELLNKNARKEINPLQGFTLFLAKLRALIIYQEVSLPDGGRKEIFKIWKKTIEEIAAEYSLDDKLFIARILGIKIPKADRQTFQLEAILFPRHMKLIQTKNLYQNQIFHRVYTLSQAILSDCRTKPKTFDKALKWALLNEATQYPKNVRDLFQRYFNCSGKNLNAIKQECTTKALELVQSHYSQIKIKKTASEFAKYVGNLTVDELRFRSDLLMQLRKIKNISLRAFAQLHNLSFPQAPKLNHTQLRRIELGCVQLDRQTAARFAQILDVPKEIFFSNFSESS